MEKNDGRQQKNLQKAVATHGAKVLPPTLQLSATPKKVGTDPPAINRLLPD